jgi:hypothetical protein
MRRASGEPEAIVRNLVCSVCILDAYLLLVVDAVEEATGKNFEGAARASRASFTVATTGGVA